jgi:hypothetical protein
MAISIRIAIIAITISNSISVNPFAFRHLHGSSEQLGNSAQWSEQRASLRFMMLPGLVEDAGPSGPSRKSYNVQTQKGNQTLGKAAFSF